MLEVVTNYITWWLGVLNYLGGTFVLAFIRIPCEFYNTCKLDWFTSLSNLNKHQKKVQDVQAQIRVWNKAGRPGLLCSSRPSWKKFTFQDIDKSKMNKIVLDLEDIVDIDVTNQTITVEPRICMGTLTRKLLALGWTIPVVPELEELTVGGLVCGAGLEASSHKYGYFYRQCLSYEVVLPSGEIVICSKDLNADLFDAIPMSYGTLGFLTAVQLPLIKAKGFVKMQYFSAKDAQSAIKLLQDSSHEFVEGLQYNPNKFVIIYGDFVDSVPPNHRITTFLNFTSKTFYGDTETYFYSGLKSPQPVQYVPIRDYYHRHSKVYFWCWSAFVPWIDSRLWRYTFGWITPTDFTMVKYINSHLFSKDVLRDLQSYFSFFLQDYLVPVDKLPGLLDQIHKDLGIYPIWLCPCCVFPSRGMIRPRNNVETLYIDVGVYGLSRKKHNDLSQIWKKYEKYTYQNQGQVNESISSFTQFNGVTTFRLIGFYTDSYLTRQEFETMFPHGLYSAARQKYGCNGAFPFVYDKISMSARNPNMVKETKQN